MKETSLETLTVGDGATHTVWTDSHAGTVVARTEKTVTWQRDKAVLLNGSGSKEADALEFTPGGFCGHTSGTQRYGFEPDPAGEVVRFSKRTLKDGSTVWKVVGQKTRTPGGVLSAGRHEHYDFNF